ncbi:alpha/beta hydrolase [Nocardia otitidiscaviarum]|uniref:alpha/beta hydrolase n=2 Tax=Nocardia otitidiscaviarum TaxID=1823 RepID=UPI0006949606|nr:alpha/beta hydrolase [Nocardia otitidiscaviarum]MBF6135038.1 alpha/beta hydrolase [Nocardia otitidiscaviarum]
MRPSRADWLVVRILAALNTLAGLSPLARPLRATSVSMIATAAFTGEWIEPVDGTERVIVYLHGGALLTGGRNTHRRMASRLAHAARARILMVDYPQLPHAGLDNAIATCLGAYRHVLTAAPTAELAIAGDSVGAHLAMATVRHARTLGLALPVRIALVSPWIDLTEPRASHANDERETYFPPAVMAWVAHVHAALFGPIDSTITTAELAGLPPTLILVGGGEALLPDAQRFAAQLTAADVPARLCVYPGQMHNFVLAADIVPEARRAIDEIADYLIGTPG